MIGGKPIFPDPRAIANASTLMAHALQGPLVAVLAVIAWPRLWVNDSHQKRGRWFYGLAEYLARLMVLIPLVIGLILFDVPFVLAGELWGLVLDSLDPNAVSLTVLLKAFLQGGGRIALALTAGLLSVLIVGQIRKVSSRCVGP